MSLSSSEAVEAEELLQHEGVLVGGALDVGGDAPVVDQARVGQAPVDVGVVVGLEVVEPDHGLGVADVDGEEHGGRRYEGRPRGRTGSRSADVEADVEGGRRLGDLAGAETGRRRWRRRRPTVSTVMPPLHSSSGRGRRGRPPSRRPGRRRPWPPRASCCRAARRRRRPRAPGASCVEVGRPRRGRAGRASVALAAATRLGDAEHARGGCP